MEGGFPTGIDRTDALLVQALCETFPAGDLTAVSATKEAAMASDASKSEKLTIYDGESVFVEQLLPAAHSRLVTITADAPLREAARLFGAGTDLVVVCGTGGAVVGVITKTDVVARISQCQGAACTIAAAVVMSADVLLCTPRDLVHDVWSKMQARGLKNVPIADADGRPLGVLNARDALGVMLQDVKYEESLLRDYVMGIGYH